MKREAQERNSDADRAAEDRLELMPRSVRDKLDRVGIKLHLRDWQQLTMDERERLRDLPCAAHHEIAGYMAQVEQLVRRVTGCAPERLTTPNTQHPIPYAHKS